MLVKSFKVKEEDLEKFKKACEEYSELNNQQNSVSVSECIRIAMQLFIKYVNDQKRRTKPFLFRF